MAQHDMIIDNGPGMAVRTDMNGAIAALVSCSLGPIEPVVMYAGQLWLDTSVPPNGVMRQRDLANAAWIAPQVPANIPPGVVRADVAQTFIAAEKLQAQKNIASNRSTYVPLAGNYLALTDDTAKTLVFAGAAATLSLQPAVTLGADWWIRVVNAGPGDITVDPNGAELIDGQTTILVRAGLSATIFCNGVALTTDRTQNRGWDWIGAGPVVPGVASVTWTNLGIYRRVRVRGMLIASTANALPRLEVSTNNGTTWLNGANDYSIIWMLGQGTANANIFGSTQYYKTVLDLTPPGTGMAAASSCPFELEMDPFGSAVACIGLMRSSYIATTGTYYITSSGVQLGGTVARNAIRVSMSLGVFANNSWITLEGQRY